MPEIDIAIVGASSLLGREVIERLENGPFALSRLRLLDTGEQPGGITQLRGEPMVTSPVEADSFERSDLVLLCGRVEEIPGLLERPTKPGATVIAIGDGDAPPSVPVINMDVNPEALPGPSAGASPRRVAAAGPSALFLTSILHAVRGAVPLSEAQAILFEPASSYGQRAMDELFQQAANIMSFANVPTDALGRQMAFNLVPLTLAPALGGPGREARIAREIERILGRGQPAPLLKTLSVPVFHGHSALFRFRPASPTGTAALRAAFEGNDLFSAQETAGEDEAGATPVEWAGQEPIRIGEIAPSGDDAWWIWAVVDDLKSGAARNAVRIAEALFGP